MKTNGGMSIITQSWMKNGNLSLFNLMNLQGENAIDSLKWLEKRSD